MVNGARVNKCKLSAGDQIQIGGTLIVLERIDLAAPVVPAQPAPEGDPAFGPAPVAVPAPGGSAPAADPFAPPPVLGINPFGAAPQPMSNPFAAAPSSPFAASNPFAIAPSGRGVAADAPEGTYEYQLVKSGPDVPADEIDGHASAIEVKIWWRRSLLNVVLLSHERSFCVGEELPELTDDSWKWKYRVVPLIGTILAERKKERLSREAFFIPTSVLGTSRLALVEGSPTGATACIPVGAMGSLEINGQKQPLQGGQRIPLATGTRIHFELRDFVFDINAVASGKKVAAAFTLAALAGGAMLYIFGSFVGHAGLLAAMAMFMPPLGGTSDDAISDEQRYLIQQYLESAAEKELEEKETEQITEDNADNREGGTGTRAKGEEGSMGNPNTNLTGNRYGVAGPQDNPDPHIARQAALRDAAEFGMIGLLNSGAGGDPDSPTAPWGRDDSLGNDPLSARGNMWGDAIGESFGAGGLGLSGIGEGGGGRGEGIGLGNIGTIGHGAGTGTGQGFGSGHGRLGGSHRARPPQVRMGATSVSGRLPPEVIQRIVRQNFGRFRLCYENGLRNNPNLQGRVSVRFVIGRDGRVSNVGGGGDLPDGGVVSCVTRAFYGLSFPQPEGGIVTVAYPIVFTPGS
jgi:hypothetical protein